jgi:CheY-like chemotaxis protein
MDPDAKCGPHLVITFTDTGTGITPEIRERIFEPFFTTKEIGKGTGHGLSTVIAIVRSHGGFINVYSEPGQGTTFKLYLPASGEAGGPESVAAGSHLPRGRGECVLLVDDEAGIRELTGKTLEQFGYRVRHAANGAEALALYVQHREDIAVVLTDMAMPVMDGPAAIIALKSLNPAVRIICSSGLASNEGIVKTLGAGVQHFLAKPYTAETILKTLAAALSDVPAK